MLLQFLLNNIVILQNISGIRLVDTFLKRTYDYDEIAQVYVTQHNINFAPQPSQKLHKPLETVLPSAAELTA